MVGESLAIVVIILVMAVMYLRAGKVQTAGLALPLLCSPIANLLGAALWRMPPSADPGAQLAYRLVALGVGLVGGIGLCVFASCHLDSPRGRWAYLLFAGLFLVLLTLAYVLNLT